MSLFVLDTDVLSLWQHGHPSVMRNILAHSSDQLMVTVITVQEQLDGWRSRLYRTKNQKHLAAVYQRLTDTIRFLSQLQILSFSESAMDRYNDLRKQKLNVGKMDLRIAAIVLQEGGRLVTRNLRDFSRVPGLAIEDWTK